MFQKLVITSFKAPFEYSEREVNNYFQKVDTYKDAIKILAKNILHTAEYNEEEGIIIQLDKYKNLADYIGWLIWVKKEKKAANLIRGLMHLSNDITFTEFMAEIMHVHPLAVVLIKTLQEEFVE